MTASTMLNKPTTVGEEQLIDKLLDNMALREGIEKAHDTATLAVDCDTLSSLALYLYEESKKKIGVWKIPTDNDSPLRSVEAYHAYRIAKAVHKLVKVCIEKMDTLRIEKVQIDNEDKVIEMDTKLEKLTSFLEKYWAVENTQAWLTGKLVPVVNSANLSDNEQN